MADDTKTSAEVSTLTAAESKPETTSKPAPISFESEDALQDHVNRVVKDRLAREQEKSRKQSEAAAAAAEARVLAEQGEFKKLAEQRERELAQLRAELDAERLNGLKREVGQRLGLPDALALRLQGSNADELEADAKTVLAALPKATAPKLSATAPGANGTPAGGETDAARRRRLLG